jgi:hypothetical protein
MLLRWNIKAGWPWGGSWFFHAIPSPEKLSNQPEALTRETFNGVSSG